MTDFPEAPDFPVASQAWKRKLEASIQALTEQLSRLQNNTAQQNASSAAGMKALAQQIYAAQVALETATQASRAPDTLTASPYSYATADGTIRGGANIEWAFDAASEDDEEGVYDQDGSLVQFEVWVRAVRAAGAMPEDDGELVPSDPENDSRRYGAYPVTYAAVVDLPLNTQHAVKVRAISANGVIGDFSEEVLFTTPIDGPPLAAPSAPSLTSQAGSVYATWDGKLGGAPAPAHLRSIAVDVSPFQIGPWTRKGSLAGAGTASFDAVIGDTIWVSFVPIDSLGKAWTRSSAVEITVVGVTHDNIDDAVLEWIEGVESSATQAEIAAANAQTKADAATSAAATAAGVADGKADVLIQSAAPATAMRKATTLWIDTTGGNNTPKRWSGSAWVAVTDKAATDAAAAAAAAVAAASAAQSAAGAAQSTADAAVTSASGRNALYHSTLAPSGTGTRTGDIWHQWSSNGVNGKLLATWVWSGSAWQQRLLDETYIPLLDIGAGTYGVLSGDRLMANSISAGKVIISDFTNRLAGGGFDYVEDLANWKINATAQYGISTTAGRQDGSTGSLYMYGAASTQSVMQWMDVVEGERYRVTWSERVDSSYNGTASNGKLRIGGVPAGDSSSTGNLLSAYSWQSSPVGVMTRRSEVFTVPTGVTRVCINLSFDHTSGIIWLDNVAMRLMNVGQLLVDGDIDGRTITGAIVRTAASGQRIQLDTTGLRAYNSSNSVTGQLSASSGGLQLTGSLRSTSGDVTAELTSASLRFSYTGTTAGYVSASSAGSIASTSMRVGSHSTGPYIEIWTGLGTVYFENTTDVYFGNATATFKGPILGQSVLQLNTNGGDITLGGSGSTISTAGYIRSTRTGGASPTSTAHAFQIGPDSGSNLRLDANGIHSVSNGAVAGININTSGGNVTIGSLTDGYIRLRPVMNSATQANVGSSGYPLLSIVESTGEVRRATGPLAIGYMRHISDANENRVYLSTNYSGSNGTYLGLGADTAADRLWVNDADGRCFTARKGGIILAPGTYSNAISGSYRVAYVGSDGQFGYVSSARKYKQDIQPAALDPAILRQVPITHFRYIADVEAMGDEAPMQLGTIADDLDALGLKEFVYYDEEGEIEGVAYDRLGIAALALAQTLANEVDTLRADIAAIKAALSAK